MPTYRNPCANNPLLRKGGAHMCSKSAQRSRDHYDLMQEAAECLEAYYAKGEPDADVDDHELRIKGEQDAPFSFLSVFFRSYIQAW